MGWSEPNQQIKEKGDISVCFCHNQPYLYNLARAAISVQAIGLNHPHKDRPVEAKDEDMQGGCLYQLFKAVDSPALEGPVEPARGQRRRRREAQWLKGRKDMEGG